MHSLKYMDTQTENFSGAICPLLSGTEDGLHTNIELPNFYVYLFPFEFTSINHHSFSSTYLYFTPCFPHVAVHCSHFPGTQ